MCELAAGIERRTRRDGTHPTALPGLTLYRASAPTEPVAGVCEPSLCLIAQGGKQVTLGGEVFAYGPTQFLLASVDLPVAARVVRASASSPYLAVRVPIDPAVVGELVADRPTLAAGGASPARGLAVSPVGLPLLDAVGRLVDLLDAPADLPVLAPLVLREIVYRLLAGPQGPRLRQMAEGDGQARRVARAIRWLRAHFAEPLRIGTLAREARMSPSALFEHFKAVTALSPLQYQKRLRLQEARRLLLAGGTDAAGVGFRVGYESPSQFSREYRRQFGAPPGRDAAASRAVPAGGS